MNASFGSAKVKVSGSLSTYDNIQEAQINLSKAKKQLQQAKIYLLLGAIITVINVGLILYEVLS